MVNERTRNLLGGLVAVGLLALPVVLLGLVVGHLYAGVFVAISALLPQGMDPGLPDPIAIAVGAVILTGWLVFVGSSSRDKAPARSAPPPTDLGRETASLSHKLALGPDSSVG